MLCHGIRSWDAVTAALFPAPFPDSGSDLRSALGTQRPLRNIKQKARVPGRSAGDSGPGPAGPHSSLPEERPGAVQTTNHPSPRPPLRTRPPGSERPGEPGAVLPRPLKMRRGPVPRNASPCLSSWAGALQDALLPFCTQAFSTMRANRFYSSINAVLWEQTGFTAA